MKYVALLRGINVGGNNKVEMSKLKLSFESLGFKNVSTYINSGNVIFETKATDQNKLSAKIEEVIEKDFGLSIRVVTRDERNIKKVCKKIPSDWINDKDNKTDVMFLWSEFASKETIQLIATTKVDSLLYVDGAIIWHLKKKDYSKSGINKFIGTDVYKNMTARNVNTVRKLVMMF